jgi:hypothetical protein
LQIEGVRVRGERQEERGKWKEGGGRRGGGDSVKEWEGDRSSIQ